MLLYQRSNLGRRFPRHPSEDIGRDSGVDSVSYSYHLDRSSFKVSANDSSLTVTVWSGAKTLIIIIAGVSRRCRGELVLRVYSCVELALLGSLGGSLRGGNAGLLWSASLR